MSLSIAVNLGFNRLESCDIKFEFHLLEPPTHARVDLLKIESEHFSRKLEPNYEMISACCLTNQIAPK